MRLAARSAWVHFPVPARRTRRVSWQVAGWRPLVEGKPGLRVLLGRRSGSGGLGAGAPIRLPSSRCRGCVLATGRESL